MSEAETLVREVQELKKKEDEIVDSIFFYHERKNFDKCKIILESIIKTKDDYKHYKSLMCKKEKYCSIFNDINIYTDTIITFLKIDGNHISEEICDLLNKCNVLVKLNNLKSCNILIKNNEHIIHRYLNLFRKDETFYYYTDSVLINLSSLMSILSKEHEDIYAKIIEFLNVVYNTLVRSENTFWLFRENTESIKKKKDLVIKCLPKFEKEKEVNSWT